MSPVYVNGRYLGVSSNGIFTSSNTDPIAGGKLWPEASLTWNAMRKAAMADGIPASDFVPAGPNSSARGRPAQDYFWGHQPPPAARPYTSNHGWGIAVDVKTQRAVAWMHAHASKYGWSHDEGAQVGEWWHWRYVGVSSSTLKKLKKGSDPLKGIPAHERLMIERLHYHRTKRKAEAATGKGPKWKKQDEFVHDWYDACTKQMRALRADAKAPGKGGWAKDNRGHRYQLLKLAREGKLKI